MLNFVFCQGITAMLTLDQVQNLTHATKFWPLFSPTVLRCKNISVFGLCMCWTHDSFALFAEAARPETAYDHQQCFLNSCVEVSSAAISPFTLQLEVKPAPSALRAIVRTKHSSSGMGRAVKKSTQDSGFLLEWWARVRKMQTSSYNWSGVGRPCNEVNRALNLRGCVRAVLISAVIIDFWSINGYPLETLDTDDQA